MNNVALTGRLGQDPEITYFESGKAKSSFSIAVKGLKKDEAIWIKCEAWEKKAELIGEYFKKGSQIGINGRLAVDQWEEEGKKQTRTYVVVETIDFLDKKEN